MIVRHRRVSMARMMQRVLKWFGIGLTGLAALALAGAAYVYVASERILHRKYEAPLVDITVPTDPAAAATSWKVRFGMTILRMAKPSRQTLRPRRAICPRPNWPAQFATASA